MAKPESLKPFVRRGRPSPLSVEDVNRLVKLLNQLINLRVNPYGTIPSIEWDEVGPVINLAPMDDRAQGQQRPTDSVRVTICNADTGELEQWELYGRKL